LPPRYKTWQENLEELLIKEVPNKVPILTAEIVFACIKHIKEEQKDKPRFVRSLSSGLTAQ